jgi:hypothetical protein
MFKVPSMGAVLVSPDGSRGGARIAMWEIWLELAERHAGYATECRIPGVDLMGSDRPADKSVAGSNEFQHTMLAVAASAHAIDGLYGSVKRYVQPPISKAARPRQILETLKHGFVVGKLAQRWMVELDWLFDLRDSIVHHCDDYRPLRVAHESEDVLVAIPVELSNLGGESAVRAARTAREIVDTCRSNPTASGRTSE